MKAKEILSESEGGINIEVAKKEGGFIHKGKGAAKLLILYGEF